MQISGVDFMEKFSPAATDTSIRIVIAYSGIALVGEQDELTLKRLSWRASCRRSITWSLHSSCSYSDL